MTYFRKCKNLSDIQIQLTLSFVESNTSRTRFSLALSLIEICSTQTFVTLGIIVSESSRIRQTSYQLCVYMSSPFRDFVTTKNSS